MFKGLEALQHHFHGLEVMSLWQRIMQGNEPHDFGSCIEEKLYSSTPFAQIFTEVSLLVVIIAATNSCKPRDPEPMLHFLETWEKLLLDLVLHNIFDLIVMPKLIAEIGTWDPCREIMPINAW